MEWFKGRNEGREKKIVVTKRFRKNIQLVYQYLLKEFSSNIAYLFLTKIEERIELIVKEPTIGKPSLKRKNIRSIILSPHNQIFYRYSAIRLKFFASLICENIQRRSLIDIYQQPGQEKKLAINYSVKHSKDRRWFWNNLCYAKVMWAQACNQPGHYRLREILLQRSA